MYDKIIKLKKSMPNSKILDDICKKAKRIRKKNLLINIEDMKAQVDPDRVEHIEYIERVEVKDA